MEAHAKTQELLVDLLTVIGQSDIALWELRESVLYPKLSRDFVDMLKNLNKKKEDQVSSRFSTNKMFHEKLDEMVNRARKNKLDGVLDSPQRRHNKRGALSYPSKYGTGNKKTRQKKYRRNDSDEEEHDRSRSRSRSRTPPRTRDKGKYSTKKHKASKKGELFEFPLDIGILELCDQSLTQVARGKVRRPENGAPPRRTTPEQKALIQSPRPELI